MVMGMNALVLARVSIPTKAFIKQTFQNALLFFLSED